MDSAGQLKALTTGLSCNSSATDDVTTNAACTSVNIVASGTKGGAIVVTVTHGAWGSIVLPMVVHQPSDLSLVVGSSTLAAVTGWRDPASCVQMYQSTAIHMDVTFPFGTVRLPSGAGSVLQAGLTADTVGVVQLAVVDGALAVIGQGPGSTVLRFTPGGGRPAVTADVGNGISWCAHVLLSRCNYPGHCRL